MASAFPEDSPLVDDLMTCSICTEPYTEPKVLACHHTFCTDCLKKYIHTYTNDGAGGGGEEGKFPCPVCRTSISVPDTGLEALSIDNPQTEELQDLVTKISKTPKRIHCDVCKYRGVTSAAQDHCTQCSINYCDHCSMDHEKHRLFESHATIPVAQMDSAMLRCEAHEAEHVKYYCATCMAPLCTVCAVSEHRAHNTMDLNVALGNKMQTIQKHIMGMSGKVQKHEEMLIQLEEIVSVREAALKKTKSEIERHTAGLIAKLNLRKDELIEELERAHAGSSKQINLEKENCTFQLVNMKSLWKFAAKLMEPSQAIQLIAMHADLMKMVDNMVAAQDPAIAKDCIVMNMFMPKDHLSIGELQKCELSTDLLTRVSEASAAAAGSPLTNGARSPPGRSPRAHSPLPFLLGGDGGASVRWHSPKLMWKADKIGTRKGELSEAYDVKLTESGNVVVAEWLNQRVQIFDSSGYSRDVVGEKLMQPWGVAMTHEGHLAVSDEKDRTVKVFSVDGFLVHAWKKMMFGWPRGIVINRAGQFIVTDNQHGRHSVSIHLPNGKCVRQFGSQGSGNEQFHWPRYVTCDSADRIIVADSSNHCVKVFDATGNYLFKFGSLGGGDGQMKHPRGVCVDPHDNIIVCDQDNDRISIYSADGKFMKHLLKIQRPWGVALNWMGLLAVTHKPALLLFRVFDSLV